MKKKEGIYLIVLAALIGILLVKSFYLDEYKPRTEDEELFKEYAQELAYKKYDGFLIKNNLVSLKVISIKKLEDEGISIIELKKGDDKGYETAEIAGKYGAKVRKYLFHFFPYGEIKVLSRE